MAISGEFGVARNQFDIIFYLEHAGLIHKDNIEVPANVRSEEALCEDELAVEFETDDSRLGIRVEDRRSGCSGLEFGLLVLRVLFVEENFDDSLLREGLPPYLQAQLDGELLEEMKLAEGS